MSPDDDAEIYDGLSRVVPLPETVRGALDREWQGYFVQGLVSDVLFSPRAVEPAQVSKAASIAAELAPAERELVQKALDSGLPEHDPYQAKPVVKLADDLYRSLETDLERGRFDSLLVSTLLLVQATSGERQSGDDAVLLAGALGADYAPDVEGLLEAWRMCDEDDDLTRDQIAWVAGRAPFSQLLERLAPAIASDPRTLAPFIGAAASWSNAAEPPLTPAGDKPKVPELASPTELINDMLMAAPPPEMAAPTAPPPMAEMELAEANGGAEPEAPAAPGPRWILVWVADAAEPDKPLQLAFRAGAVHEIAVAIGPNQEGAIAAVGGRPFDEELGPVADMEELTVTFLAPSISMQQSGSIFLPRTGTSRRVTFAVKLPADLERFDAEIRVHHKNRAVQMARLSGPVVGDPAQAQPGSRIELEVATIVPENVDLGSRAGADAGIVRTDAGTTAVAGEDFLGFDDDRLGRVIRDGKLLDVLTDLATSDASRRRKLEDAVDDLRALVFQGCELYPVIGEPLVESLAGRPLDRLQVLVDERSDFFPLELVYDLPAPTKDATLCRGWKTALRKGTCGVQHEAKEGELYPKNFCPSGFWGLSKVIERRVIGDSGWHRAGAPEGFEIAVRLDPTTERDTLESPGEVLFAASDKVDEVKKGGIESVRKTLDRIAKEATFAKTWAEWVEGVAKRPTLLVLLSHTTEEQSAAALEIGDGETCLGVQLLPTFVRASEEDAPIVLLLGCDTAVTDELQSFVSRFQDRGAALVVGTTASVLGQRAAPVAQAIATEIAAAAKRRKPIAAGDLITSLRRKLLAKGELTALCLTAFGDAGWQLGGRRT